MITKAYWSLTFNDGSTSSISSGTLWVPTWCQKDSSDFFQRFDHHLPPLFQIQNGKIDAQEEFLRANMDALHWLGNPEPTEEKKHYKQKTESGNALEEWWSNQLVFSNNTCCGELRFFLLQLWTYLGESQLQPVLKDQAKAEKGHGRRNPLMWRLLWNISFCQGQLNKLPCHSVSEWVSDRLDFSVFRALLSCCRHMWPFWQLIRRMRGHGMTNKTQWQRRAHTQRQRQRQRHWKS